MAQETFRRTGIGLLLGLLLLVALAPAQASAAGPAQQNGGAISVRSLSDWDCFDPERCLGSGTLASLYATLVSVQPSGKIVPYLAKSWVATPTSITFTLRDDATCEDGTKVTPTVVMKSYQRLIDMKAKNNLANFGQGPFSVSADEQAGTFTFTTQTPDSDLIYGFGDVYPGLQSAIVCPAGYADPKETMNSKAFGAGPYILTDVVHGDHATMKLRPDFTWGPDGLTAKTAGVPETVTYKMVVNQSTASNMLLTGGLDAATIQGPDVGRLLTAKQLTHVVIFSNLLNFLHFNETPGKIAADPVIRQALITAIDPAAVNQAETDGRGKLSLSWFLPGSRCYDPATEKLAPKPSVEAARALLIANGWTFSGGKLSKDGKPLTVKLTYANWFGPGPEYIQAQWTQLGATVPAASTPMTTWVSDSYINGNFDASLNQPFAPIPLYAGWKSRLTGTFPPQGTNWPRTADPVLEQEASAAIATTGDESCKHWAGFQEELWKGWHILPLYSAPLDFFTRGIDVSHGITGSTDLAISPLRMQRVSN